MKTTELPDAEHFAVKVDWDESDECFYASVPALPGVLFDAPTAAAALKGVRPLIREVLRLRANRGASIPAHDAVMEDIRRLRPLLNLSKLAKSETVSALQELTRLAVQAKTGVFSRLILDVGGSRDARREELARLVARAADRIEAGAAEAALPPMSSYERKLVHDLVKERGLHSESRGEGAERHTVITRAG